MKFPLTANEFLDLLKGLKTAECRMELTKCYTNDLRSIVNIITEIHPLMKTDTKKSLTWYRKQLEEEIQKTGLHIDSIEEMYDSEISDTN